VTIDDAARSTQVACVIWAERGPAFSARGRQPAWLPCQAGRVIISKNSQALINRSVHKILYAS